jgi:hypothetical protein
MSFKDVGKIPSIFVLLNFGRQQKQLLLFIPLTVLKMSGQTWGQESQTNYNLELREYKLLREF